VTGQEEMIGALVDITAARHSQDALHAAQADLAHANRVATLGEISASIAHEVNQPLAAIISNAQACLRFLHRESPDLDDVTGTIQRIVKDGVRASEVILRLRALMNKSEPKLLPLCVNELVREVVILLQRELTTRRVAVRLELMPGSSTVIADRIQLQQVVINLIMNGIEAMHATDMRELTIRSHEDDAGQAVVAVIDCGVGFGSENPDRLFQAFFSTKPDGLGIGLSICRSIIEVHGGRIWASANAECGATFRFSVPVYREPRSAAIGRSATVH
jgi:C4-dicarboxylate-specific signal transduction histidine kinase